MKLYLNEEKNLNLPPSLYDDCGMFLNIGWDILFEDDGGELKYDREDIWDPVIPSFFWKTAEEFFAED